MRGKKAVYCRKVRFELTHVLDSNCLVVRCFSSDESYLGEISAFCLKRYWTKNILRTSDYIAVYLASEVEEDIARKIIEILTDEFNAVIYIDMVMP